jgi:urease beta subunit
MFRNKKEKSYQKELKERKKRREKLEKIVKAAIAQLKAGIFADMQDRYETTLFMGTMGIDPINLSIYHFFQSDADLEYARSTGLTERIDAATRSALRDNGYPVEAIPRIWIRFATEEDVQRTADGDYWRYFR